MPASREWPAQGIETIGACPVCGSAERELLFAGLQDKIFHCAPGNWDMQRCRACRSGYLDPRPTAATIGAAYEDYHTHEQFAQRPAEELGPLLRIRRSLANGYKNARFGTTHRPASRWGVLVGSLVPAWGATLDRQHRHLPRRPGGGRVLDVGFGDGGFLEQVRAMGWTGVGTDFDPEVVKNARARGLDAHLGTIDGVEGPFDAITMSHVIEHVHDPMQILRACFDLLVPGGSLWIETPNVDALGLEWFGPNWRGLEPPRHLVLFNRKSLVGALKSAGFDDVRDYALPSAAKGMYQMSKAIAEGRDVAKNSSPTVSEHAAIAAMKLIEWVWRPRREFLGMIARKA